ncbi:PHB depolymerase family esterase [Halobacillus sp. Marseille-P3879]|uniref:alpha/beta hydrolase family esterase n=1 Tax=Halobacillus sp. Marseille-P3879 TaxID=2045014 RepID=UPI0013590C4F|nr:PHB depolymerase family esterase [Halobacillus sp. Marseille-P3879]
MDAQVQVVKDTLPSMDGERTFYYTLPNKIEGRIPLVFCFHGAGSSAKHHMRMTGLLELSEIQAACFVFPEAMNMESGNPMTKQFNEGRSKNPSCQKEVDDAGFVIDMIDYFRSITAIDEKRIYVTGFSNGSAFAMKMAIDHPDLFAGVGGVGGPVVDYIGNNVKWKHAMPLIFFMGKADPVVPFDGHYQSNYMIDQLLSARQTALTFVRSLSFPVEEEVFKKDGYTRFRYFSRNDTAEVVFYEINESGHTWPGGPFQSNQPFGKVCTALHATELMWEFLKKHRR